LRFVAVAAILLPFVGLMIPGASRSSFRDDVARHSEMMAPGVPI
jgi:hypothetical protein